jgi:hypothetical protein
MIYWKVFTPCVLAASPEIFSVASAAGQFPSVDRMTIHSEFLVGGESDVILTWHDPPPWVAPPWKLRLFGAPTVTTLPPPSAMSSQPETELCLHHLAVRGSWS